MVISKLLILSANTGRKLPTTVAEDSQKERKRKNADVWGSLSNNYINGRNYRPWVYNFGHNTVYGLLKRYSFYDPSTFFTSKAISSV